MVHWILMLSFIVTTGDAIPEIAIGHITRTCDSSYGSFFDELWTRGRSDCQDQCVQRPECQSYTYSNANSQCRLNNDTAVEGDLPVDCGIDYGQLFRGYCEPGWLKFGAYCYKYIDMRSTWNDSRAHCLGLGGDLAVPASPALLPIFENVTRTGWETAVNGNYWPWVGVDDIATEGDFRDPSGHPIPSDVAVLYNWNDGDCGYAWTTSIEISRCTSIYSFLCEISAF